MTQTEIQDIFLQHIIASLQNDITYLESLGSHRMNDAAYHLRQSIKFLTDPPREGE